MGTRARARRTSEEPYRDEGPGPSGLSVPLPSEALLLSDGVKGSPELKNLLLLAVVSEGERIEGVLRSKGFAGLVVAPLRQQSVQAAVRQALGMAANQRADSAGRGKAQLEKWLKGKKVMVVDDTLINRWGFEPVAGLPFLTAFNRYPVFDESRRLLPVPTWSILALGGDDCRWAQRLSPPFFAPLPIAHPILCLISFCFRERVTSLVGRWPHAHRVTSYRE